MKELLFALALIGLIGLSSCGDDEDQPKEDDCTTAVATGMIDGQTFTFGEGIAFLNSDDEFELRLHDTREELEDSCDEGTDFVRIFGIVPAVVGRTELFLNLSTFEGKTLTFFNPDGFSNIIAVDGFIEITSITDTTVDGLLNVNDGLSPSVDHVCGTFTLCKR